MTLREIRSNCGSHRFKPPRANTSPFFGSNLRNRGRSTAKSERKAGGLIRIERRVRRRALREFAQYISSHSSSEADGGIGEDEICSSIRLRIIEIRERRGAQVAKQVGIVGLR